MFGTVSAVRLVVVVFGLFAFVQMEEVTDEVDTMLYSSAVSLNLTVLNSSCWDNEGCNVAADLTRVHLNFTFLAILNCTQSDSASASGSRNILSKSYTNVSMVALNGCNVNRDDTLGVEFVPDPPAVRKLSIRMFHIANDIPTNTFIYYDNLDHLNLTDNIIDGVSNDSFSGLNSLQSLHLSNCDLRYLDDTAFAPLTQLKSLFIREPWLHISHSLELPDVIKLVLIVDTLYWCFRLPDSLEELSIIKTHVILLPSDNMEALNNLTRLKTFSLVSTNVTEWPSIQSKSIQMLNLSHNNLDKLSNHNLPSLHTYDVSTNDLHEITNSSIRLMPKLRFLYAQNNKLETISPNAFVNNALLQNVDLSGNQLHRFNPNLPAQQDVLIQIDDNQWSCRWADDFSTSNPQVFARFRYAKVLDSLNTRGLRCKFYEQTSLQHHLAKYPIGLANISTSIPILRRNPKDTAVLTLIILVVGVAILFLMLFLHIKCRKDGLPQFNRFLPADSMLHHQMAERTDFVRRKLPPTEYEAPIVCRHNTPPLYDVEKRHTDEGVVYEEIPDRISKSSSTTQANQHNEDSSPPYDAIKTPIQTMQKSNLHTQFQIGSTTKLQDL